MINVSNNICIGCGACVSICPKNCISLEINSEGFLYPTIEKELCINCNKCSSICVAEDTIKKSVVPINSYAVYTNDNTVRMQSSSGGCFYALSKEILDNGGVVIGAAFDKSFTVKHIICNNEDDLRKILKSKYSQSNTSNVFEETKQLLENGLTVLFSGTSCQCSALNKYLKKEYNNLLLVDVICHGVPSPMVFRQYLKQLSKGKKMQSFNFRDKSESWQHYSISANFEDGDMSCIPYDNDLYMKLFLSNLILRKSCYNCQWKYPTKVSDITLGDLWGADTLMPLHDDKGINWVIINSNKGNQIFDRISSNLFVQQVNFNSACVYNPSVISSPKEPIERSKCIQYLLNENSFLSAYNKFIKGSLLKRFIKKSKSLLNYDK
jgi:coenzyme F420-reducing hydrogenase beta subunit